MNEEIFEKYNGLIAKDYFINASKEIGQSILEYYNTAKDNYVLVEDGFPILWRKEKSPYIFESIDEALDEVREWGEIAIGKNIKIITEQDFINEYCKKEMDNALIAEQKEQEDSDENMLTYFMNPYNSHSEELVLKINRLWKKNMAKFEPILVALYKRDIDEIYDADSFASLPNDKDAALSVLIVNWSNHAYNYLMHIADDGDLETIIDFIRDREIKNND